MIVAETIFVDQQPVGVIRQDTNTKQANFSPIDGKPRLPDREWESIDELKAAVLREYKNESPPG